MKQVTSYNRHSEYHLAQSVARGIAEKRDAVRGSYGYQPNPMRRQQLDASTRSIKEGLRHVSGIDVRDRVHELLNLDDENFRNDVRRCLGDYR